jgi:hypothetical protein
MAAGAEFIIAGEMNTGVNDCPACGHRRAQSRSGKAILHQPFQHLLSPFIDFPAAVHPVLFNFSPYTHAKQFIRAQQFLSNILGAFCNT